MRRHHPSRTTSDRSSDPSLADDSSRRPYLSVPVERVGTAFDPAVRPAVVARTPSAEVGPAVDPRPVAVAPVERDPVAPHELGVVHIELAGPRDVDGLAFLTQLVTRRASAGAA